MTFHTLSHLQELRERVLRGKYRIPFYMSTDCENLLKKFLILNPSKRGSLEVNCASLTCPMSTNHGFIVFMGVGMKLKITSSCPFVCMCTQCSNILAFTGVR